MNFIAFIMLLAACIVLVQSAPNFFWWDVPPSYVYEDLPSSVQGQDSPAPVAVQRVQPERQDRSQHEKAATTKKKKKRFFPCPPGILTG